VDSRCLLDSRNASCCGFGLGGTGGASDAGVKNVVDGVVSSIGQ
jgi:hypothetical protein